MHIFKTAAALQQHLEQQRSDEKTIGFVPTMGALHAGHLSLLQSSLAQNDLTVCSIFVNPTQFNNPTDFKHYPITIEKDLEALLSVGCDVLFLPPVSEIYPPDHQKKEYDLGELQFILEGAYRPGHFQGVCEVVDRLLQLVAPNALYMGQKDYQQCMVVQRLLAITNRTNIDLHIGTTLREEDGLAMSSRNLRLNEADRKKGPKLFAALQYIKENQGNKPDEILESEATVLLQKDGFAVDYVAIRQAADLQPPNNANTLKVALVAATINGIRLIDNLPLN